MKYMVAEFQSPKWNMGTANRRVTPMQSRGFTHYVLDTYTLVVFYDIFDIFLIFFFYFLKN